MQKVTLINGFQGAYYIERTGLPIWARNSKQQHEGLHDLCNRLYENKFPKAAYFPGLPQQVATRATANRAGPFSILSKVCKTKKGLLTPKPHPKTVILDNEASPLYDIIPYATF